MLRWESDSPRPHRNTKTRREAGFWALCNANIRGLSNDVLQGFGSAELRNAHSLYLDGFAGSRVATCAGGPGLCLKDAKACDGNLLALLQRLRDAGDNRLNSALSVCLCAADCSGNLLN